MAKINNGAKDTRTQDITLGILTKIDSDGVFVDFPDNPSPMPLLARSTVPLGPADAGREVALLFEFGDLSRPLILGLIHQPSENQRAPEIPSGDTQHLRARRIVFEAGHEIVLKTKMAKLVLRENGDIEIHGSRIVSRARTMQKLLAPQLKLN